MNELVAWLRDCLNTLASLADEVDETERIWHVEGSDDIVGLGVWAPHDRSNGLVELPMATSLFAAEHIAHHDPHAVLARVEAERALIEIDNSACDDIARWLAYGHRFDIPGYDPRWAPEKVAVR